MYGTFVDIAVVIVLLGSALVAFLRGFIREVLTIFGIFGGVLASYSLGPVFIPTMRTWMGVKEGEEPEKLYNMVPYDMIADVLAYGIVLVVFVVVLSFLSHFISEAAKRIGLGPLDRTLGVVFGLARGIFVLGLLWMFPYSIASDDQKEEWFADSKTAVYLNSVAEWMTGLLPKNTAEKLDEAAKKAGDMAEQSSGAREALENMQLLGGEQKQESGVTPQNVQPNKTENTGANGTNKNDGYNQDFREDMNKVFDENAQPSKQEQ